MKQISEKDLIIIRNFIIDNVVENTNFMFNETLDDEIDIISLVCSLYNVLHEVITGEEYNYFFHWANKIGGACDDDYIKYILSGENGDNEDV